MEIYPLLSHALLFHLSQQQTWITLIEIDSQGRPYYFRASPGFLVTHLLKFAQESFGKKDRDFCNVLIRADKSTVVSYSVEDTGIT